MNLNVIKKYIISKKNQKEMNNKPVTPLSLESSINIYKSSIPNKTLNFNQKNALEKAIINTEQNVSWSSIQKDLKSNNLPRKEINAVKEIYIKLLKPKAILLIQESLNQAEKAMHDHLGTYEECKDLSNNYINIANEYAKLSQIIKQNPDFKKILKNKKQNLNDYLKRNASLKIDQWYNDINDKINSNKYNTDELKHQFSIVKLIINNYHKKSNTKINKEKSISIENKINHEYHRHKDFVSHYH